MIYTITYKFTYVYETVRSLHIRVKIFKNGQTVRYGKPSIIRSVNKEFNNITGVVIMIKLIK